MGAALGYWLAGLSLTAAGGELAAPLTRVLGTEAVLAPSARHRDLLVMDGRVEVRGLVEGHLYAVDSEVHLGREAAVLGSITLVGGRLQVEGSPVLPPELRLEGAALELQPALSATAAAPWPGVEIVRAPRPPATVVHLLRHVLGFDRPAELALASGPGLGLVPEPVERAAAGLLVAGLVRVQPSSGRIVEANQRGFRGPRGAALLTAFTLADETSARELYASLEAAPVRSRVELSLRSELGEGAHWFFRHRGRYVMIWQVGVRLFAVETRLDTPASPLQQVQFLDQVLQGLRGADDRSLYSGATP